jgi:hypothetical protein
MSLLLIALDNQRNCILSLGLLLQSSHKACYAHNFVYGRALCTNDTYINNTPSAPLLLSLGELSLVLLTTTIRERRE